MSVLSELKTVLASATEVPFETGTYQEHPEGDFGVILPMTEQYELHADNNPGADITHIRLEVFTKGNYLQMKKQISKALLRADFTITARGYVEYEQETGYHHFYIDVARYELTEVEPWQQSD